jgi:hypothetical protein
MDQSKSLQELPSTVDVEPLATTDGKSVEPLLAYLGTTNGHEIASRILSVVESVKQSTLDKSSNNVRVEKYIQFGAVVAVITATTFLVYSGKFDASVGVLFGTVVGYAFGKK